MDGWIDFGDVQWQLSYTRAATKFVALKLLTIVDKFVMILVATMTSCGVDGT
jgi:hypothetical protein